MIRSRLRNKTNKSKNPSGILKFKWQRNLVADLSKQAKLQYFEKLNVDYNSKLFCKACKPYFSNKNSNIEEYVFYWKGYIVIKTKGCRFSFS